MFWIIRSHGQAVKTSPSHGGIRGSSPLGSTNQKVRMDFFLSTRGLSCWRNLMQSIRTPDTQGRYSRTRLTSSSTRGLTLRLMRVPLGVPIKSPHGLFSFHKGTYNLRLFDCRQSNPLGSQTSPRLWQICCRTLTSPLGSTSKQKEKSFLTFLFCLQWNWTLRFSEITS